jgi:proteasome lid subunit RPN8/RPN11
MTFSMRAIIRGFAAPEHRLSCSRTLWQRGLAELCRRGHGRRESGAFLLGHQRGIRRSVTRFVYYDDLDPDCLDSGIVVFDGSGFGPLWTLCRDTGLRVVADVHTHGGLARQSPLDRDNPMIAIAGHVALIVPSFAQRLVDPRELGVYAYLGEHRWQDHSGSGAAHFFYVGMWG